MNYREKLYTTYVSKHTSRLYGEFSIVAIERQFPVWKRYFGRFLPRDRSARILDVGCGNGGFVHYLRRLGYENSGGIDISAEQVEAAKKMGINNVECADLKEFLKDKKGFYDMIFARDVIEHFKKEEILDVLSLIYSSLKKDGVFVSQTPNGESPFVGRHRYGDFTHEIAFTRSSLSHALRAVGFKDMEFCPTGPVPKGLKSTVRYALWKAIEALLRFYIAVETGSFAGVYTQNIIAAAKK